MLTAIVTMTADLVFVAGPLAPGPWRPVGGPWPLGPGPWFHRIYRLRSWSLTMCRPQLLAHVDRVHLYYTFFFRSGLSKETSSRSFSRDGVQSPSTDVFGGLVHPGSERRDFNHGVLSERELDAFGIEQRLDIAWSERSWVP